MERRRSPQGAGAAQRLMDATGLIIAYPDGAYERLLVLRALAARIAPRRIYSEREINALIQQHVHPSAADHITVRRDLVDYQLLSRTDGGSRYWLNETSDGVLPQVQAGPGTIGADHVAGDRETE